MESTTHERSQQFPPTGANTPLSDDLDAAAKKAADAARRASDQISQAAAEKFGQAKQKIGDVADQVNQRVNDQYDKAMDYTRQNPGTAALIAFGAGIGVGLLLVGNFKSSRRRRNGVVEPVITAISTLAYDLFT